MNPGVYRRRIRIATGDGIARADLEDDPHRVGVRVRHDGRNVIGITGATPRTPWSRCPEAAGMLERLIGMALAASPLAVQRHTASQHQCTHLLDIAGLAISHAARGIAARQYDAEVTVPDDSGPRHAILRRDGRSVLSWSLDETTILGPGSFAGRDLRSILPWAEGFCATVDDFEAVIVLRRAVHISKSRLMDLDTVPSAAALGRYSGACYVFQPERMDTALRNPGCTRDFTGTPDGLLNDTAGAEP